MRALVVFAHPCEESFSAALKDVVVGRLAARGWQVDLCDLYAEGFDPVLTAEERRAYHDIPGNTAPVAAHVDRLRAAEALIFVYPTWNFGFPAILKGYIDRVFLPGVSFVLKDGLVAPGLRHIRKLAVVTSYGATPFRAWAAGNPPKRYVTRVLRYISRPDRLRYLALYDMNRANDARRRAFLARVAAEMDRL
ncbi:MAG: NAD(P)H-dependent oxidoreductase [Tabrizicola sp.]|jgi:putative NADPH-quinone reductase|nr:NAD(P)H-dependent oxidoreductase [Tabrizicola sp.]